jgi:hypothetical protein
MPVDSATRQKAVTTAGASASRTQSAALEIASSAAMRTGSASRRPGVWGVTEDRAAQQEKSAHARSQICPSDRGAHHFSMTAARTPCYTARARLREALQLFSSSAATTGHRRR